MHPELETLLALQAQDDTLQALEQQLASLAPRVARLEAERRGATDAVEEARAAVAREEAREAELAARADEVRRMNDRAVSQLDLVHRPRDAAAASAQAEQSRRALSDAESATMASGHRLAALRATVEASMATLDRVTAAQADARAALDEERAATESRLAELRGARAAMASRVPAPTLGRYDRIRRRRHAAAVFALRHYSCGSCDTAIPTQRRNAMAPGWTLEVCESCGVLLYAEEDGSH